MKIFHFCPHCGSSSSAHISAWVKDIFDRLVPGVPSSFISKPVDNWIVSGLEMFLRVSGLARYESNFPLDAISLRSSLFIGEARKSGWQFSVLKSFFGYTERFIMRKNNKMFRFEGLPQVTNLNRACNSGQTEETAAGDTTDKWKTKKRLQKLGFPVPEGRAFWFFQKKEAVQYAQAIGFPLVVKPRGGTFAKHVFTNISGKNELRRGIKQAVLYAPTFMVERYYARGFVHRATAVGFEKVFCVKQVPANVVGDGKYTIAQLAAAKSNSPERVANRLLRCLDMDSGEVHNFLHQSRKDVNNIPPAGEIIYLHKDPFMRFGGDLVEETGRLHPDNRRLFLDIAKEFKVALVGIDFIAADIGKSWREQECAVLELNNLPCIEMHMMPSWGKIQNVAGELVSLADKYYV